MINLYDHVNVRRYNYIWRRDDTGQLHLNRDSRILVQAVAVDRGQL